MLSYEVPLDFIHLLCSLFLILQALARPCVIQGFSYLLRFEVKTLLTTIYTYYIYCACLNKNQKKMFLASLASGFKPLVQSFLMLCEEMRVSKS